MTHLVISCIGVGTSVRILIHNWQIATAATPPPRPRENQWRTEVGVWGVHTPSEIPKAFQNRAKLNPIVKTVKNS